MKNFIVEDLDPVNVVRFEKLKLWIIIFFSFLILSACFFQFYVVILRNF